MLKKIHGIDLTLQNKNAVIIIQNFTDGEFVESEIELSIQNDIRAFIGMNLAYQVQFSKINLL